MSLPHAPGMRIATLPRNAGDKPQETSIAVNPRDPQNLIASFHQAVGEGSDHHPGVTVETRVAWSADGGATWTLATGTSHQDFRISVDASVAFDLRGHAYLVYFTIDQPTYTSRQGEYVARSIDGGRTWEAPVARIEQPEGHEPLLEHMPHIVADNHPESPHAGNVYVVCDRFGPGRSAENLLVRSTDGGETWSQPVFVDAARGPCMAPVVGRDGALYLMTLASHGEGDLAVEVVTSRDGGQTFETPISSLVLGPFPNHGLVGLENFPRSHGWPVMAIDPTELPGRLFVVWGDHRNGDRDIFSATSDDGGRSWTEPVRVNDDPLGNGKDQLMQFVAVDPTDGSAYVLFYDRRGDPDNLLARVTLARSSDGGRTFTNYAWGDAASDPMTACLGDYVGLAALEGRVYGAWPESLPTNQQMPAGTLPFLEMEFDLRNLPFGPSAIRIGIADFSDDADSAS